jgi:hypothetical protein
LITALPKAGKRSINHFTFSIFDAKLLPCAGT